MKREDVKFLSTLSLRRATKPVYGTDELCMISIHALLAESDGQRLVVQAVADNFYPRSP